MRRWVSLSLVLVSCGGRAVGTQAGGGGSSVPPDGTGGSPAVHAAPIPIDQVPVAVASALCTGLGTCCASKGFAFSQSVCEAAVRGEMGGQLCDRGTVYDPQALGDCVAAAQAASASCLELPSDAASACDRICLGTTALGGACTNGSECARPSTGSVTCSYGTSMSGVCALVRHGQAGEPCIGSCDDSAAGDTSCAEMPAPASGTPPQPAPPVGSPSCYLSDGLYCASNWTCQPVLPPGSRCTTSESCQAASYCSPSSACTPSKAEGEPCTGGTWKECLGRCDFNAMRCTGSAYSLAVTAESCAAPRM